MTTASWSAPDGPATPGRTPSPKRSCGRAASPPCCPPSPVARPWPKAINDAGVIVGVSWKPGTGRATVWKGNKPQALPQPPHSDSSTPLGINRSGEIVGRAGINGYEPMYWASVDAEPVEINQLIG